MLDNIKYKLKIYLKKRRLRMLKKELRDVGMNLYFDGWTGKDCINEKKYLNKQIKRYEEEIISMHI